MNYEKYGQFQNVGTRDYYYRISDREGLADAVGEGIFPNTKSVYKDPGYKRLKREGRLEADLWEYNASDDYQAAFYKWATTGKMKIPGVKLYFTGLALEKGGHLNHALKAYYALIVHFPDTMDWTFFHTPWYPAQVALDRIHFILKKHPELGLRLEGAEIEIINGYDNDEKNDIFVVNPGTFLRGRPKKEEADLSMIEVIEERGGDRITLRKYANGHWQLLVEGEPYLIKGIAYAPSKIGLTPSNGSLIVHKDWMVKDFNANGRPDGPFDSWVDKDRDNERDQEEEVVGDFQLLQEMGANTIRLYHHGYNKECLSEAYEKYGLMVLMGDYIGMYALGSGASWNQGTDYTDSDQQKNMMDSVKEMVEEYRDEPYILMWVLGNENNYGVACNADREPDAYYQFANKVARWIKENDPEQRPVALCNGDVLYLDKFARYCPDIDVYGTNTYRGKDGFGRSLWEGVKRVADKPVLITEYGCPAYARNRTREEAERWQAEYHRGCWQDIAANAAGYGAGNSLGGVIFEWVDEWWKSSGSNPYQHNKKGEFKGPFLDGWLYEEWMGITSQGDGSDSPFLRQLRPAYFMYKEIWNK